MNIKEYITCKTTPENLKLLRIICANTGESQSTVLFRLLTAELDKSSIKDYAQLLKMTVIDDLHTLSIEEKFRFLKGRIYEHVEHSMTGKLLINTKYCRLAANLLGGDYDKLNKIQKVIFKSDLVFEKLNPYQSFDKYALH